MSQFKIPYSLDDLFSTMPLGSVERAEVNNLYGINHRQINAALPMNKDAQGLTFFVRPQLNLLQDNIRNNRRLYTLLTTNDTSIPRFVRNSLDPRLAGGYFDANGKLAEKVLCPLVDEQQAFIPVLSNNLTALSGWPDMVQQTFSSKPGVYQEIYSQVDGNIENYGEFDIDATFRNIKGDPILYMFYIWLLYESYVFQGTLMPYPDFIVENEIDYCTRIYRLVLDSTKTYVKKISATGACFPISVPTGQFFDYSSDKPYNEQTKDITVRFRCMGAQYLDDILVFEFNKTVVIFNVHMKDGTREQTMTKVNPAMLTIFNNRGYPRINPDNYKLEWWVDKTVFAAKSALLDKYGLMSKLAQNLQFNP